MEKHIQVFNNTEFGEIRTMEINGEPWFVGKDIAAALGYSNPSKALIDHVDEEDKLNNETLSSLGQRGGWLINESGMYSLILGSKLEGAKRFKRWVTSEILPTIRKTGAFATDSAAAELKARELRVKEMNAQARLINAETRRLLILQKEKGLSKVAVDASRSERWRTSPVKTLANTCPEPKRPTPRPKSETRSEFRRQRSVKSRTPTV